MPNQPPRVELMVPLNHTTDELGFPPRFPWQFVFLEEGQLLRDHLYRFLRASLQLGAGGAGQHVGKGFARH